MMQLRASTTVDQVGLNASDKVVVAGGGDRTSTSW
jgi:hypothetical protein